jgi:uncharacterized membrane protein (UPF0127 family)
LLLAFVCGCQTITPEVIIANKRFDVEIADTPSKWMKGLMYRKTMSQNHGILFIFQDEQPRSVWMKNTKIPLDLIFIDSNCVIVYIEMNTQPCQKEPCKIYNSPPAKYVIEINANQSSPAIVGDTVTIP